MELLDGDLLFGRRVGRIDAVISACSDEEIVRFIPLIAVPYERSDAEWWIERADQAWVDGNSCRSRSSTTPPERFSARSRSGRSAATSGTGYRPGPAAAASRPGRSG